jgi:uncharacterized protein (DUF1015 family)
MPRFEPFGGLRYDATVPLDQVIAPPYDVIGDEERARLAERHPDNAVHLELPQAPTAHGDPYAQAAELLSSWLRRTVLRVEQRPSFYLYEMTTRDGATTRGVIGALGITDEEAEEIRPHEETLPKPLGDRLHLLQATRANLSPIWALSSTGGLGRQLVAPDVDPVQATDDQGVRHRLWVLDDPGQLEAIAGAVRAGPLVIADGHHRYQTARHYHHEAGDHDSGLLMTFVTELAPGQLQVGAIHRLLRGFGGGAGILDAFKRHFQAVRAGPLAPAVVRAIEKSKNLALLTTEGVWLLTPVHESEQGAPSGPAPADGEVLDPDLIAPVVKELGAGQVVHAHLATEAARAVEGGEADAAVLLRPVSVEQIAAYGAADRRMPPKTTYFFPKPRTGMVFRRLETDGAPRPS